MTIRYMDDFDFHVSTMRRPFANYCIGCHDGSVFIDFKDCEDGTICLVRMSFDGYGCCNLETSVKPLNKRDSDTFKEIVHSEVVDQNRLAAVIKKSISLNESLLWRNALEKYQLI